MQAVNQTTGSKRTSRRVLRRLTRLAALAILVGASIHGIGMRPVDAAGTIGPITTLGTAECWGAYWTSGAKFVKVTGPIIWAYNQHPRTVDRQRVRMNAVLLRWDGKDWQYAYTTTGVRIQTGWTSYTVSDGTDAVFQLQGADMGRLTIPRQGYYMVLFDLRWDATDTVTVSGSTTLTAIHYNNNGESSLYHSDANWCNYNPLYVNAGANF